VSGVELRPDAYLLNAIATAVIFSAVVVLVPLFTRLYQLYGRQRTWVNVKTGLHLLAVSTFIDFLDSFLALPTVWSRYIENALLAVGIVLVLRGVGPISAALAEAARTEAWQRVKRKSVLAGTPRSVGVPNEPAQHEPIVLPPPLVADAQAARPPAAVTSAGAATTAEGGMARAATFQPKQADGAHIIGNIVGDELLAEDGRVIATKGQTITREILLDARRSDRVLDLIVNMILRERPER